MTTLQLGDRTLTGEEIIPLLTTYQLLPQFLRELIIDQAIAPFECTPEETLSTCPQFDEQHQFTGATERQAWLERSGMNSLQWEALVTRRLRIEKFKQATWGHKIGSYFLSRKDQMDQVIYSLIRTKDEGLAEELYFRVQEREQSFAELAQTYAQGPEAQTGGLIGPIEVSNIHPTLAQILRAGQLGQLWPPLCLGEWVVLLRLEKVIPAQLDASMRQRLFQELFEAWLQEQISGI